MLTSAAAVAHGRQPCRPWLIVGLIMAHRHRSPEPPALRSVKPRIFAEGGASLSARIGPIVDGNNGGQIANGSLQARKGRNNVRVQNAVAMFDANLIRRASANALCITLVDGATEHLMPARFGREAETGGGIARNEQRPVNPSNQISQYDVISPSIRATNSGRWSLR